jgi:dTDP-4-dehydrorhamnose 3,5-epimerase
MNFEDTPLAGLKIVTMQPIADDRGHFARCYCADEFAEAGIKFKIAQRNQSMNYQKGTIRGLHWQNAPHQESKFVSCSLGSIFDVAVDLRKDSPTYLQWFGMELTEKQDKMLFVPEGFAHGYQALTDNAMAVYSVGAAYHPASADGMRYDDPAVGIIWPIKEPVLSEKDQQWPLYETRDDVSGQA